MFVDFSSGKEQSHAGYFLQEKKKGSHGNTNISSTVCHYLFFVLDALLSLQTKDNRFWASDLQQHFNWRDFAENAEE